MGFLVDVLELDFLHVKGHSKLQIRMATLHFLKIFDFQGGKNYGLKFKIKTWLEIWRRCGSFRIHQLWWRWTFDKMSFAQLWGWALTSWKVAKESNCQNGFLGVAEFPSKSAWMERIIIIIDLGWSFPFCLQPSPHFKRKKDCGVEFFGKQQCWDWRDIIWHVMTNIRLFEKDDLSMDHFNSAFGGILLLFWVVWTWFHYRYYSEYWWL